MREIRAEALKAAQSDSERQQVADIDDAIARIQRQSAQAADRR